MNRREPVGRVVPALASLVLSLVLSGCTFSFGGTTEVTESGEGAAAAADASGAGDSVDRKPAQPTPKTPHVSKLCDSLTAVYLTDISDAESAASLVNDWLAVTKAAPASLKDDLSTVGAYLVAAAKRDYPTVKKASGVVGDALDHIDAYVTKVCRA